MTKALKIWNGRGIGIGNKYKNAHIFIAAYSAADARRLCLEAGADDPGAGEIKNYWHKDCWGKSMDGITPERGIWVLYDKYSSSATPERII